MKRLFQTALAALAFALACVPAYGDGGTTISGLPNAGLPLGSEAVPIVQNGVTRQAPAAAFAIPPAQSSAPTPLPGFPEWWDTSTSPPTLRYFDGSQWVAAAQLDTLNHAWNFAPGVVDTDPTLNSDSDLRLPSQKAAKTYVDNHQAGLNWKSSVLVETTGNVTLSGEQTIDGHLTSASRVLVNNQTTASQNGIYITGSGAWTRATDLTSSGQFVQATVLVTTGTANAATQWNCTCASITVGTSAVNFVQISTSNTYSAGDGLGLSANQFAVDSTVTRNTAAQTLANKTLTAPIIATISNGGHTITVPSAADDTLAGKATTDTFTNKTFDTAGAGNSLKINGVAANDNTGTGKVVRDTSATLLTPNIGAASATSINKVSITPPATGSTLTLADGKTLAANNSLTLAGIDGTTETFQGTGTVVNRDSTDILTNKSIDAAEITSGAIASARGGAGNINGALKGNGSGTVSQAACGDLSNAAASCATDATNASNIGSGTLPAARLPNPSPLTLGGVESLAAVSHKVINQVSLLGVPSAVQLGCGDLSDAAPSCNTDTTNAGNITSGTLAIARMGASISNHYFLGNNSGSQGNMVASRPACADLSDVAASCNTDATNASNLASGTVPASRLPVPAVAAKGGVFSKASVSHQYLTSISATDGSIGQAAVTPSDVTGAGTLDLSNSSAGQVKFPSTQNASSDPNTLDDYVEGTSTPTITFGTPGDLSVSYSTQSCHYTKIGNRVGIDCVIVFTPTFTTANGGLSIITNGPNSVAGNDGPTGAVFIWGVGLTFPSGTTMLVVTRSSASVLNIRAMPSATAQGLNVPNFTSGNQISLQFSISYRTV